LGVDFGDTITFHANDRFHVIKAHVAAIQDKIAGKVAPKMRGDFPVSALAVSPFSAGRLV